MTTATTASASRASDNKAPVTNQRIMGIAWGFAGTLILEAAMRNGFFDALNERPLTAPEVARATSCSFRGARMVLDALVGLELLTHEGDRYALGEEAATFLVASKPTFSGGMLKHTSRQLIPRWLDVAEIVRTGTPETSVNQQGPGSAFFSEFVEDIFSMSYGAAKVLADATVNGDGRPFSVLDLAAGSGVWGIALAQKSPAVHVTAVDWAGVIPVTKKVTARHGVSDRFTFVEGDLLEADFGHGHQLATLGHILHSEGESRSRKLLKRVHAALEKGGTIAIAEFVPDEDRRGPAGALIFAVNMLVNTDEGDTFTFKQIKQWLQEAGFSNVRTLEAPSPSPLILADK